MKRAVIYEPMKAGVIEAQTPHAVEDWALVKILATPMCTEYKRFQSGPAMDYMGHEAVGEVVEIAQPGKVKVGDRVVVMPQYSCGKCALCISGDYIHCVHAINFEEFIGSREGSATYAQYILKPSWLLQPIPEGMSYEMASLSLCALGPSFGAFNELMVDPDDTLLITGAGPVGLGAVVNAKYLGAQVIVVESVPWRVERSKLLGADVVLDPENSNNLEVVKGLTGGVGVDKAIDCSGVVTAQRFCIDATRRKGKVAFVGECMQDLKIKVSPDMIRKGLTLIGSWHYNLALFSSIMEVIQNSPSVKHLISHCFPMSKVQEAFEISASHQCAKIILDPWQ